MPGYGRMQLNVVEQNETPIRKLHEYLTAGMDTVIDIAQEHVEHGGIAADSPQAHELQQIMEEYLKMEREQKQFLTALQQVKDAALQITPEEALQLPKMLDQHVSAQASENTDEQLHQNNRFLALMEEFNKDTEEPDKAVAATETLDQESEIEVTQQDINTKCPYTAQEMVHPVKNKQCGHNYDRDGIKQYIQHKGNRARCPVSGCANRTPLTVDDLEDNRELKRFIDKKNRNAGKKPAKKK